MVLVEFLGPLNKEPIRLDIKNLKELKEILKNDKDVKEWLEEVAVAVNDKIVNNLDIKLKDGDKITLLPPVCGGWNDRNI